MYRITTLATIAWISARYTWQSTDAVFDVKVESLAHRARWHLLVYHLDIFVNKSLPLAILITTKMLERKVVCNIILIIHWLSYHILICHLRLLHLLARHPVEALLVLIVGSERHHKTHVRLRKLLNRTISIGHALSIHHTIHHLLILTLWGSSILLLLITLKDPDMHLIVALVSPVVFRARHAFTQQAQHREHHIWRLLLTNRTEFIKVYSFPVAKAKVENSCHFFEWVDPLLEGRRSATLLRKLAFAIDGGASTNDWHACNDCNNICFRDILIVVEIVYVKDKLYLLVELRAVDTQKAC